MEDNYTKAYKEIVEILRYVPKESVNKIPREMINMFKSMQSKTYEFQIDTEKKFDEQVLLEETKAILANIFRDYWASNYEKARIIEKESLQRKYVEQKKREKYNPNVFVNKRKTMNEKTEKKKIDEEQLNIECNKNNLPIEIKRQKFLKKLIKIIKEFLHIN